MARFKLGVANAMLFSVSRSGNTTAIQSLLEGAAGVPVQINVVDEFGRSPLYWAVQVRINPMCMPR